MHACDSLPPFGSKRGYLMMVFYVMDDAGPRSLWFSIRAPKMRIRPPQVLLLGLLLGLVVLPVTSFFRPSPSVSRPPLIILPGFGNDKVRTAANIGMRLERIGLPSPFLTMSCYPCHVVLLYTIGGLHQSF